jgi:hypothetical protein
MRLHDKGQHVTAHFDSMVELAEHTSTRKKPKGDRIAAQCSMGYVDATTTAQSGGYWENGVDRMADNATDTATAQELDRPAIGLEQCGFAPCVPAYMAGSPDNMLAFNAVEPTRKLIRIGVSVAYSCRVNGEQVANRGRAILANVNALERAGYSVELVAVWGAKDGKRSVQVSMTVKESHDAYAPTSVAFSLTEDGFARRLLWTAAADLGCTGKYFDENCMGYPSDLNAAADFDIWIPSFKNGEVFDTQEEADNNIGAIFTADK